MLKIKISIFLLLIAFSSSLSGQELKHKKDELENSNKTTFGQIVFAGILVQNEEKKQSLYISPIIDALQFNTVEGFVTDLGVSYTKYLPEKKFLNLKPRLRYGFGNNHLRAKLDLEYYYTPSRYASIKVSGGKFVEQLNAINPISAFNNTYYTLLLERNFLKIYDKTFFNISHVFSPFKDFLFTNAINWSEIKPLDNLSNLTTSNSNYTSNSPTNIESNNTEFSSHQTLNFTAELSWQHKYERIRSRGKFKSISKYPELTIRYQIAAPNILNSSLSFQKLSFKVKKTINYKSIGHGQYHFETGDFIKKDSISFVFFNHFNGSQTIYSEFNIEKYQLLDYYQYSTTSFFIENHYQHHFDGFLLRKIPVLKKSKMQSVLSINHLYTSNEKNYFEFGIGLEKIFNKIRLDYYVSFRKGQFDRNGFRFGILF